MRSSAHSVLIALALALSVYTSARGLWWQETPMMPAVVLAGHALYLITTCICLFAQTRPGPVGATGEPTEAEDPAVMPVWAAALALATAVLVPNAVWVGVGPEQATSPNALWTLGAIGALMTIVMVRRRPWLAWLGILALSVETALWIGLLPGLAQGLVGAVLWVAVSQALVLSTDRAARDAVRFTELQRAASTWLASQSGRQRERRVQVQRALAVAGPVLARTVATGGDLDTEERVLARLAEGRLRDELRGPRLLDDDVRRELESARRRGATVTVLDEGGLEGFDEPSLAIVRRELAETLRDARSERLYIRTSPHETVAVTVVGRSRAESSPQGAGDPARSGDETVDLWREISIPQPTAR